MKYATYQSYKFSGTDWIGEIPSNWECRRLKDCGALLAGAGFPHEYQGLEDEELPFYKVGDLSQSLDGRHMASGEHTISRKTAYTLRAKVIPPSAIVYAKIGAALLLNRRRITVKDCCIDNNMTAFIPNQRRLSTAWVYYWLSTLDFGEFTNPGAVPSLSEGYQATLPIALPPLDEQQTIARFLDAKTAQIDALVAQKRQLIEKLKEKRQALIARTVTRGLPPEAAKAAGLEPNPEMKNANQLWLGEIPLHWGVKPLKFVTKIKTGFAFSSDDFTDEGVPVVRIGDISRDGQVDLSDAKYLPVEYQRSHAAVRIKNNDILMAMTGATIGKAARYTANSPALLNQRVCAFRALPTFHQGYLWFILNSDFYIRYVLLIAFGGAQPNISDKQLLDCCVPVPPLKEQVEISMFLEIETGKLDDLMTQANLAIDRLTEYRQALITSAVTGKIDLRELA